MRRVNLIAGIIVTLLIFTSSLSGAEWTTDVQVSNRTGVFDVELVRNPHNGSLFAALAWEGDGSSAHLSTDGGQTWTETYHGGPGAILSDIALAYNGDYFYIALALPTVCVLYRFDATTGAQVPWGGLDWILITAGSFVEIELTSPDISWDPEPQTTADLHFVGFNTSHELYYAKSTGDMSSWEGGWPGPDDVHHGLSAISVYNPYGGAPTNDVYISYVQGTGEIFFNTVAKMSCLNVCFYNLTYWGGPAQETDLAAVGIPGEGGVLYSVFDGDPVGGSPLLLGETDNFDLENWTYYIISATDANLNNPAIATGNNGQVGLAYTRSTTGGPLVLVQGKFEHHFFEDFASTIDAPGETYPSASFPRLDARPSMIHTLASGFGILYVRHNDPRYAYYTRRDLFCGQFTGGYTGNVDCSSDGKRNLADITRLIDRVYISKLPLDDETSGNIDGDSDSKVNLADITRLVDHVYISKEECATCR